MLRTTIRGVAVEVPQVELECDRCGETRIRLEDAEAAEERAAATVREHLGLLQPEEIRELRARLDLTQEQLEEALGLGTKTVVRWETGRVMQNKATDNLLRLVDRDPTALEFLSDGATVPAPADCWPKWIDLPLSLRRRLRSRSRREETTLCNTVLVVLSEQLTLDGVTRSFDRLKVDIGELGHESGSVEPWLRDHRDRYERAS